MNFLAVWKKNVTFAPIINIINEKCDRKLTAF